MDCNAIAQKYEQYVVNMRRWFHQHPEVSGKEYHTSERVKTELDRMGIEWRDCGLETGILATVRGAKPGRTILLRGDMDALTVPEETGCDYQSQNEGISHACGHDCHTSMLLTAAAIVNDMKADLVGNVVFAFQPAEEIAQGAKSMIEHGALEGVDACFGMHVWSEIDSGQFAMRVGPTMASADQFMIDVKGVGGHGATPHLCHDAVTCACAIVQNLQQIVSREVNPVETAVVTVGTVNAGTRWNVVAENAHMEGTTRCFSYAVRDQLFEAIQRVATQTPLAHQCEAKVVINEMAPPTVNDKAVALLARESAKKILGDDCLNDYPITMGAEDFSFFQMQRPGAMAFLGVRNPDCDAVYAQHHCKYQVDEAMLIKGAQIYAQVALDFLNQ